MSVENFDVLERETIKSDPTDSLVDADRRGYERVAYRFVLGYGPGSTPGTLDRLGVTA